MDRQIIIKPLGLITQPNNEGIIPPGALSQADNVVLRDIGILDVAPIRQGQVNLGAVNDVVRMLAPLDGGITMSLARTSGDVWAVRYDATGGTFPSGISTTGMFSNLGYLTPVRALDRVFLNSLKGVMVQDVMAPASGADRTLRRAGLPQPQLSNYNVVSTNAGTLPDQKVVGFSGVFRRNYANGYTLTSVPSPIRIVANTSGAVRNADLNLWITGLTPQQVAAGDILELYRTDFIPNVAGIFATDPGATLKLVQSYTITSADVAAQFANITDRQAFDSTTLGITPGRELYSNPGIDGALGIHRMPNICRCVAVFKGFAFYGGITERARFTFTVPGGVGSTALAGLDTDYWRTNGIGLRVVTGTVTIGSPNITGVSASHLKGIVAGQRFSAGFGGASFPPFTTVLSAGAGTIVMSANASASGTGISVFDTLQLDSPVSPLGFENGYVTLINSLCTNGLHEVTVSSGIAGVGTFYNPGVEVSVEPILVDVATVTARATNGQNYSPAIPEIGLTPQTFTRTPRLNFFQWSAEGQPEHVPLSNESKVGAGAIIAMASTRDALWIFCTDGLYRLSGANGLWRTDQVDTTLFLSAPHAWCVLRDCVYAYTNRGLVKIDDSGISELTNRLVNDLLPGPYFTETPAIQLAVNEVDDEILLIPDATAGFIYNTITDAITRLTSFVDVTAVGFHRAPPVGLPAIVLGTSLSGFQPSFAFWNSTAFYFAPTVQYQPVFGDDPFTAKQWMDATFLFDVASATKAVTPVWNGTPHPASPTLEQLKHDARMTVAVPRALGASGHTLAPGYQHAQFATRTRLKGLCLRYAVHAEQTVRR